MMLNVHRIPLELILPVMQAVNEILDEFVKELLSSLSEIKKGPHLKHEGKIADMGEAKGNMRARNKNVRELTGRIA